MMDETRREVKNDAIRIELHVNVTKNIKIAAFKDLSFCVYPYDKIVHLCTLLKTCPLIPFLHCRKCIQTQKSSHNVTTTKKKKKKMLSFVGNRWIWFYFFYGSLFSLAFLFGSDYLYDRTSFLHHT